MSLTPKEKKKRILKKWKKLFNFLRALAFFQRQTELSKITRRDPTEHYQPIHFMLIRPDGRAKVIWTIMVCIFIFVTAIFIPFFLAFYGDEYDDLLGIIAVTWLIDIVFLLDLYVTLFSAHYLPSGAIQKRVLPNLKQNCDMMLFFDLIASFPSGIAFTFMDIEETNTTTKLIKIARLPRIYLSLKMISILRILKIVRYR